MKAIETIYKGYRFRSRLEARWAVFFDTLAIRYEYEQEGYEDKGAGIRYLPDFWLSDYKCWLEIKGQEPTDLELAKALSVAEHTKHDIFLFFGSIPNPQELPEYLGEYRGDSAYWFDDYGNDPFFEESEPSHFVLFKGAIWSDCEGCESLPLQIRSPQFGGGWCCKGYHMSKLKSPRLIAAYTAARQARFEYGENGR